MIHIRVPRPIWIALPTVALIVAVAGLQVGLPVYRRHQARRTIQRLRGLFDTVRVGPEWLRELIGEERAESCDPVRWLCVDGATVTHDDLAVICTQTSLEELILGHTRITDVDLEQIGRLHRLRKLMLHETPITSAGLAHLRNLGELRNLDLSFTAISDEGLRHLAALKKLERLGLAETSVTDAGIADLQRALPGLKIER
jgi:hypothetical protein